jgi:hypothetical protein
MTYPKLAWRVVILFQVALTSWTENAFSTPYGAADEAQAHADRGLELAQAGDLRGAEAELRLAVTLSPNNLDYLAGLGGIPRDGTKAGGSEPVF